MKDVRMNGVRKYGEMEGIEAELLEAIRTRPSSPLSHCPPGLISPSIHTRCFCFEKFVIFVETCCRLVDPARSIDLLPKWLG